MIIFVAELSGIFFKQQLKSKLQKKFSLESSLVKKLPSQSEREKGYLVNLLKKKIEPKHSVERLFASHRILSNSSKIVEIFATADKQQLNFLVSSVSLRHLLMALRDEDLANQATLVGSILTSFFLLQVKGWNDWIYSHRVLTDIFIFLVALFLFITFKKFKIGGNFYNRLFRSELIQILTEKRTAELNFVSKATIIDALFRLGPSSGEKTFKMQAPFPV